MIFLFYGTRPEWIKIKPIIFQLKKECVDHRVIFVSQHKDYNEGSFDEKILIETLSQEHRLTDLSSQVLDKLKDICELPKAVLVQGDTTTALSVALFYFYKKIPVIHLEAGLRSFNLDHPFPEEANRQMISRISQLNLCPTDFDFKNLLQEGISINKNIVVGNSVLDNIKNIKTAYKDYVVFTMHRRENLKILKEWFIELARFVEETETTVVYPIHYNEEIRKLKGILHNVKIIEPIDHNKMTNLLSRCKFVITDSGGIQEEASFFQKRIVICRETTERQAVLNSHGILCKSPMSLNSTCKNFLDNYKIDKKCPFGDGNTASRVVSEIRSRFLR